MTAHEHDGSRADTCADCFEAAAYDANDGTIYDRADDLA